MSYQALYRKWRPTEFDKIVGQDAVVQTLKNQIKSDRIGHAYLFCGTRGTGKTSAAKIFARAANCPNAAEHDGNPCNCCEVCTSIQTGRAMNVFEIDAASNNGVDNIRDIRDQVEYPPVTGRFKVYIIDEAHMLTAGAANALLKTLEEPPEYVIFILATTDPQKIPATILSRCQRYDFRRMSKRLAAEHLKKIAESEGLCIEDRALEYIAEAGDGSMRDALSILDQCAAYHHDGTLSYDNVLEILGAADTSAFSDMYRRIINGDTEGTLKLVDEMIGAGREVGRLITDFIWYLRNVLLAGSVSNRDVLDISDEKYDMAAADAAIAGKNRLIAVMASLAALENRVRFSSQKRVLLEVELIRLCTAAEAADTVTAADGKNAGMPDFRQQRPEGSVSGTGTAGGQDGLSAAADGYAQDNPASARIRVRIKDEMANRTEEEAGRTAGKVPEAERHKEAVRVFRSTENDATGNTGSTGYAAGSGSGGGQQTIAAAQSASGDSETPDAASRIRNSWKRLVSELDSTNRPLFNNVSFKEEDGSYVIIFRSRTDFKIAATNKEENALIRLRDLVWQQLGLRVNFKARVAKPGEIDINYNRATDEELAKINFPISIED